MWRTLGFMLVFLNAQGAAPISRLAVGDQLPPIRGQFLTGRAAELPQAASGRAALLMLGFTYDSRFAVEDWARRFRQDFGARSGVTFFEIPMIGGVAVMGKWFIDGGMRRGTPRADQENVITVYGGVDLWKQRLGFRDPKAAYLILINPSGRITWLYAGEFDQVRYNELSVELSRLVPVK